MAKNTGADQAERCEKAGKGQEGCQLLVGDEKSRALDGNGAGSGNEACGTPKPKCDFMPPGQSQKSRGEADAQCEIDNEQIVGTLHA
ncbi:hypothetical protein QBK99_01385 [Corticibacterium sp. UT-5YL-CI-8]|nr:hypothetical protein [Tianweitania sp. UT-5YL-CI-8]